MTVICPADANQTEKAVRAAAAIGGPCYIRLNRNDIPNVTEKDAPFELGVPQVLLDGRDVGRFCDGLYVRSRAQGGGYAER
jgi:transketolase